MNSVGVRVAEDSKKQDDAGGQAGKQASEKPSEFKIGLVTFIIFLVFMAFWMYFRLAE